MKNAYKIISSAALAAMLIGGIACSGQETATAAQNPISSSKSKQSASKPASVTHSGIKLQASNVMYDGNYVRIELKQSGKKTDSQLSGMISFSDVLIDGKSIYKYGNGSLAQRPSLGLLPGSNANTSYLIISDASLLGSNLTAFPDKFKLTAKISLQGVKQPYTLEIPVRKSTDKPVILKPDQTKKSGNLSMTLKQIRATSASTRLQWVLKGQDNNNLPSYDFVDDQGNAVEFIAGRGTDENNSNGDYYYDYIIEALDPKVKSITIKPYTPEMEDPNTQSGAFKVDSNGELVKNYIKDLEITIPVK